MIRELVSLTRGVLRFDSATFSAHIESKDALKRGLLLMICVALIAGFVPFVANLVGSFQPINWDDIGRQVQQSLDAQGTFNPAVRDPQFRAQFERYFNEWVAAVKDIVAIPSNIPFLPRGLERVLAVVGGWLSQPLAWIAGWLGYALWVMLFVKLLGGQAPLSRQLGATTLFAAPHIFNAVTSLLGLLVNIPVAGPCLNGLNVLLGFAISLWGIAVYVKATAVANGFGAGKATLATILPAILGLFLLFLTISLAIVALILAGASRG